MRPRKEPAQHGKTTLQGRFALLSERQELGDLGLNHLKAALPELTRRHVDAGNGRRTLDRIGRRGAQERLIALDERRAHFLIARIQPVREQ